MGIESIMKSLTSAIQSLDSDHAGSQAVALPRQQADADAVARFNDEMAKGEVSVSGAGATQNATTALASPDQPDSASNTVPVDRVGNDQPVTLADRLENAKRLEAAQVQPTEEAQKSDVNKWLDSVTDIFEKDTISHSDLFRVQVLAGMAQVETTRNASINKSLDEGMKTLIKNS